MRIKLDENLPKRLSAALQKLGHDVDTAIQEGLAGHPDPEVWEAAQREQRLLITQDLWFSDARSHPPGTHSGIVLVRLVRPGRNLMLARLVELFAQADLGPWTGCNIVVTDDKVRIRRP
jgi:predicted nuclease of predicted toxin-antitoxin system